MIKLGTWLTRDRQTVIVWYSRYENNNEYQGLFYNDLQNTSWDGDGKNFFYPEWDLVEFLYPLPESFVSGEIELFDAMFPVE